MITYHCDRCGKEADVKVVSLPDPKHRIGHPASEAFELCEDCQDELLKFAQQKKVQ